METREPGDDHIATGAERGCQAVTDRRAARIAALIEPLRVQPGRRVHPTKDFDPGYRSDLVKKKDGAELLETGIALLADYQARLAAQATHGVLVCLQALDAGGKDGTIRHVMRGVNPQGVHVISFKGPSAEELARDCLWSYASRLPARGEIGIFNRSHYEEVLVVRVHPGHLDRRRLPASARGKDVWDRRYREINDWERYLVDNGIAVVKLFLNLSGTFFAVEQGRKIYDNLTKYIRFVLILLVVFVLSFLGASLLNIAGGGPFTPAQVLWIHFFVNAAFGFALGFDHETLWLMQLEPRGQSVLTKELVVTVALTGLYIAAALLVLIVLGGAVFGDVEINALQFLWAVVPAAGLLVLWVLGKLLARRASAP